MHTLARLSAAALAVCAIVLGLGVGVAHAKVLAVAPSSPFAVETPRAAAPARGRGRLAWILRHLDGGGPLRPLPPVDQSSGRPQSLESGWTVRLKLPF
jgi:hypothetical protein